MCCDCFGLVEVLWVHWYFQACFGLSRCYLGVFGIFGMFGILMLLWVCWCWLGLVNLLLVCLLCFGFVGIFALLGLLGFVGVPSVCLLGLGRSLGTCSGFVCLLLVGLAFLFSDGRVLD